MLNLDLIEARAQVDDALKSNRWWKAGDGEKLISGSWTDHQRALARALLLADWLTLHSAFDAATTVVIEIEPSLSAAPKARPELGEKGRKVLEDLSGKLGRADSLLSDLVIELQSPWERLAALRKRKVVKRR